ncbi:hypothetical protein AGMMS49938_02550 [Fibrobacterales bacterium]|nr:hypothetical protein AGMMS49938_02550 [Fibrobacterales bacterium]
MKNAICICCRGFFVSVAATLSVSCSSSDPQSSENYIEKFSLDSISPIEVNIQSERSLIYIWTDGGNYAKLPNETPIIEVSQGATISQSQGANWTDSDFRYTVTAENGDLRNYEVQVDTAIPREYKFESWSLSNGTNGYFVPSNLRWASGNSGIKMALALLGRDNTNPENYPTKMTANGYAGNAAVMETIEGGTVFGRTMPVLSGNLYLGSFNTNKAITDELAATEFGRIYPAKPSSISGYYKYKEGAGDFNNNGTIEPSRHDSCDIYAVFYRSDLPNGKDTTLTTPDIETSDLILAISRLPNCTETAGDNFEKFELNFNNYSTEPDFTLHRYKLAIIFAASKTGANYAGKIGSRLVIDEIEIEDYPIQ